MVEEFEVVAILQEKFPEWNDQITLDEYDLKAIYKILKQAGYLK